MVTATANHLSEVERQIVDRLVADILAAGCRVCVHDGEGLALRRARSRASIMAEIGATDETRLILSGALTGWVLLIHGNREDVISDYSLNLEPLLAGANALAERFGA